MTALELIKRIVVKNKEIQKICLYAYVYVPLCHEKNPFNHMIWIKRDDFLNKKYLESLTNNLPPEANLGIFSKVKTINNRYKYLPLVDLDYPKSKEHIKQIINMFRKEEIKHGWLVETQKSYHYYSDRLLSYKEWVNFYGKCLCTSIVHSRENIEQLADTRYIGHTLRKGGAVLRFTNNSDKSFVPTVVKRF
jgi:hypothetical protein